MYSTAELSPPLRHRLLVKPSLLLLRALSPPSGSPSLCHCGESLGYGERERRRRERLELRGIKIRDEKPRRAPRPTFLRVFSRHNSAGLATSPPLPSVLLYLFSVSRRLDFIIRTCKDGKRAKKRRKLPRNFNPLPPTSKHTHTHTHTHTQQQEEERGQAPLCLNVSVKLLCFCFFLFLVFGRFAVSFTVELVEKETLAHPLFGSLCLSLCLCELCPRADRSLEACGPDIFLIPPRHSLHSLSAPRPWCELVLEFLWHSFTHREGKRLCSFSNFTVSVCVCVCVCVCRSARCCVDSSNIVLIWTRPRLHVHVFTTGGCHYSSTPLAHAALINWTLQRIHVCICEAELPSNR